MKFGLLGLLIGLINGGIWHYALWRVLRSTDRVFYTVWLVGFFARLLLFGYGFWWVKNRPQVPMVPAMLGLVAGQFLPGLIPLKRKQKFKG